MKRIFGFVVGILILLSAAQVWAQAGPQSMYMSGNIGFGIRPDATDKGPVGGRFENDPAFVINGAIGVELNPMIRIEGEIGYHHNTADVPGFIDEFTFGVVSFMGNGYFDIPTQSPLRPYVGAGLGFAISNLEDEAGGFVADDSDMVAAFQLMAGLGFDISPRATVTFGYRYFTTTDPDYNIAGTFISMDYTSHDFLFGARFRF
jgi:opacity protein-like surface antigen